MGQLSLKQLSRTRRFVFKPCLISGFHLSLSLLPAVEREFCNWAATCFNPRRRRWKHSNSPVCRNFHFIYLFIIIILWVSSFILFSFSSQSARGAGVESQLDSQRSLISQSTVQAGSVHLQRLPTVLETHNQPKVVEFF